MENYQPRVYQLQLPFPGVSELRVPILDELRREVERSRPGLERLTSDMEEQRKIHQWVFDFMFNV